MKIIIVLIFFLLAIAGNVVFHVKRDGGYLCSVSERLLSVEQLTAGEDMWKDEINSFSYGSSVTGIFKGFNVSPGTSTSNRPKYLETLIPFHNKGDEPVALTLSFDLRSNEDVFYPTSIKACNRSSGCNTAEENKVDLFIVGYGRANLTLSYDYSVMLFPSFEMTVKVVNEEPADVLFFRELKRVRSAYNCIFP